MDLKDGYNHHKRVDISVVWGDYVCAHSLVVHVFYTNGSTRELVSLSQPSCSQTQIHVSRVT